MRPGARLGPYEILAPLGAGGMGEVWRARDTRLGREVAVKVLPAEVARDGDRVARFEREARALASLSHPVILAIHDVGREGDVAYAVTELLEGETLRDRLSRERLPWRKAVEIGATIADGLAAAHERGVVHRDLKPENLFLTSDGRVKVLDFGLAKVQEGPLAEQDTMTSPSPGTLAGTVLGTVGCMAPEQVRGRSVDQRCDIFSLGCVLYEMLAGRRAFLRDTAADTMSAILTEEPPEITAVQPGVPSALVPVVNHCLEKRPEERFQSARDVAFDLKAIATDTGGTRTESAIAASGKHRTLLWLGAGCVAVLGLAAAAYLLSPGRDTQPGPALEPKRVVIAVFENQTGDSTLDPLGRMVSDWITQGLSRVEELEVVPSTSVLVAQPPGSSALQRRDSLRVLADETGAGVVVSGSYYLQAQTLYFQASITDAVRHRLLYALDPASGPVTTPLVAIDALRQRVMSALATKLATAYDVGEQRPPTYEAYREFIAGFELFLTDDAATLRHMERAAQLDPGFTAPQLYAVYLRRLSDDWSEVETMLKRLEEERDQLTPLGRHFFDGLSAWVYHRYGEGLQAMRGAQKLAPRDPMANHWVGLLAVFANRPAEAAATFGSFAEQPWGMHALGSRWVWLHCESLHMLGSYEEQLNEARRGSAQFTEDPDLRDAQIGALAALGRLEEVNRVIEEVEAAQIRVATPADSMVFAARELRAHGRREESLALAERAVAWYRGRTPLEAAKRQWQRGLAEALFCAEQWRESRSMYEMLVTTGSTRLDDIAMLGVTAARSGDRAAALEAAGELEHLDRTHLFGDDAYYRACIAASLGNKEQAVELLRQSFAEGVAFSTDEHRSLSLEPLWDYPPFIELLRPKG